MNTLLTLLAASVPFLVLPWAAAEAGVRLERRQGRLVRNYRGRDVPLGLGWAWVFWAVAWIVLAGPLSFTGATPGLLVLGAAGLGWLDDRFGGSGPKGFRGHLGALAHGRVTTGLLKLVGVGTLSLFAAWTLAPDEASGVVRTAVWLMCAAIIALCANLLNLLDLRPGRTLKAYFLIVLPMAVVVVFDGRLPLERWQLSGAALALLLQVGPAIACLPADLGERAMLGDMGANAAGAAAGFLLARGLSGSVPAVVAALVVLLALNLASERVSFSAVIEGNGVLRWIDALGRRDGVTAGRDGETGQ